jgi:hypothetical protein
MNTTGMMGRVAEAPRHKDEKNKIVGAYYLLTILAGIFVLFFHGRSAVAADLITTVVYIAATILFYELSKKHLTSGERRPNRTVAEPVRAILLTAKGGQHVPRTSA